MPPNTWGQLLAVVLMILGIPALIWGGVALLSDRTPQKAKLVGVRYVEPDERLINLCGALRTLALASDDQRKIDMLREEQCGN